MSKIPYTHDELFSVGKSRAYTGRQLDEIAFPLGGIGTGMISLGGWGQLRDFEIFNKPDKGLMFQYTFFTLYARQGEKSPVTRVIQGANSDISSVRNILIKQLHHRVLPYQSFGYHFALTMDHGVILLYFLFHLQQ